MPTSPLSESNEVKSSSRQQISKLPTRTWLKIIIVIILVVSGGTLSFVLYYSSQSTPNKTLTTFCTALLNNDESTAWDQLSSQFQDELTLPLFMSFFNGATACTPGTFGQNANTATLTLVFPGRKMADSATLRQNTNGIWKIANETGISGLLQMFNGFCNAIQRGDYISAYGQLSSNFQTGMTEDQFASSFPRIASCSYSSLVLRQNKFQITFSLSSLSRTIDNNDATLVQERGNWKIDDFSNLPTKTLTAFCSDLQRGDYQDAYDETSTAFQGGRPEANFAQDFSTLSSCMYDPPTLVNGNLTANLSFSYKNGSMVPYTGFIVRDSNNARWKIDQLVNFPDQVLTQFCTDIINQDYQNAYNLFTPDVKAQVTLGVLQQYNDITRCRFTFPVQTDSKATATLTYILTDNRVTKQHATLTEVGTDTWKIQQLQDF